MIPGQLPGVAMDRGAVFSPCRKWRYSLWRQWDSGPVACFLMMNPSTATEVDDDPTVHRQQVRVAKMGFGKLFVVNVFAWRETDSRKLPRLVKAGVDIIGPCNDQAIIECARASEIVVCAWGTPGHRLLDRGPQVLRMLRDHGITPSALKINADGSLAHPLYLPYGIAPKEISVS